MAAMFLLASCAPVPPEQAVRDALAKQSVGVIRLPSGDIFLSSPLMLPAGARDLELRGSDTTRLIAGPDFKGKATLQDVTNPLAPISLGGNLDFQFTLTDKGEPGTYDEGGISLYNGSTLYFSSNWASSQTVKQVIAGGNVVVH